MSDMVKVERFEPNFTHGRPQIAAFVGKAGAIHVHASRADGSLWLFVLGPRGGDRGYLVFRPSQAPIVLAWVEGDGQDMLIGGKSYLQVLQRGDDMYLTVLSGGLTRGWKMQFDADALTQFRACLHAWANTVLASR